VADRWDAFSHNETMNIHHALRMLLTHPIQLPQDDQDEIKRLADEIWDRHARLVASASGCETDGLR
jgi:hypothetical protein